MCSMVALSVAGVPVSHDADHSGDVAHVEHDHGGHGTVLIHQDERLLSKTISFSALTAPMVLPLIGPAANIEVFTHSPSFAHPGRDPPEESQPRAPPILIS